MEKKGYGFITFDNLQQAKKAVQELDSVSFLGRKIRILLSGVKKGSNSSFTTVSGSPIDKKDLNSLSKK